MSVQWGAWAAIGMASPQWLAALGACVLLFVAIIVGLVASTRLVETARELSRDAFEAETRASESKTRELLNIELSKEQQSSDWADEKLSEDQLKYAAADVLNLHDIHRKLQAMLIREGRLELAQACFDFLPTRTQLDLDGWDDVDIFSHS